MRRILSVRHARFSRHEGGLIATEDLLASSSNSALGFEDSELGNQVLDSMRVHPGIRSAVLYKETGQIFAWYVRTDLTGGYLPPRHPAEGVNWATSFLSFSERVFLEGKPVGKIYLEEDLNDVNSRRIHFAWVTAMMALACMTLVYLLSWRLPNHRPAHSAIGRYRAERGFRERKERFTAKTQLGVGAWKTRRPKC